MFTVTALASCSAAGGENAVFTVFAPSSVGGPATTVDVVDVALPTLTNVTSSSVTVRRISLVGVPLAVHLKSVTAYGPEVNLGMGLGDLLKYCRHADQPHPVTDDVTPPHSDSPWNVVLAITFAKPGNYHLVRDKIFYTTAGHTGWQYQDLDVTINITAARKGTRPEFDGC
jgi:hypothetical protein